MSQENVEIVRKLIEAWNAGDMDAFRDLYDPEIIMRVVDKFLMQLEAQLHEKKVDALFTEKLKEWLGREGFDPLMGARPMARLIQDTIRSALADELLFGRLAGGGSVIIDIDDQGKVQLQFEEMAEAAV